MELKKKGKQMLKLLIMTLIFISFESLFANEIKIDGDLSGANHVFDKEGNVLRYSIFNLFDKSIEKVLAIENKKSINTIYIGSFGFHFKKSAFLDEVIIMNGYQKTDQLYVKNDRVKELEILCFLDKYDEKSVIWKEKITLIDSKEPQKIRIPNIKVSDIDFRILSTYPGSGSTDICISELEFWNNGQKYEVGNLEEAKKEYLKKRIRNAIPERKGQVYVVDKRSDAFVESLKQAKINPDLIYAVGYGVYLNPVGKDVLRGEILGYTEENYEKIKLLIERDSKPGRIKSILIGEWKIDQYGNFWVRAEGKKDWKIMKETEFKDRFWGTDLAFHTEFLFYVNP